MWFHSVKCSTIYVIIHYYKCITQVRIVNFVSCSSLLLCKCNYVALTFLVSTIHKHSLYAWLYNLLSLFCLCNMYLVHLLHQVRHKPLKYNTHKKHAVPHHTSVKLQLSHKSSIHMKHQQTCMYLKALLCASFSANFSSKYLRIYSLVT